MEKKNEVVEYSKDFATSFNEFGSYELDLIVTLAYAARKKIKDHMNVNINENVNLFLDPKVIKKMVQGNVSTKRVEEALKSIFNTSVQIKKDGYKVHKHIFETLMYTEDKTEIIFELKKEFIPLFFNLSSNFTRHELLEFTGLKGRHAKRLYQIVMSYKNLKSWEFEPDEFLKILNTQYRWVDVDSKIIKKASEELSEKTNIKNLKMERVRSGKFISKIILKWDIAEEKIVDEIEEAEIVEAEIVEDKVKYVYNYEELKDIEATLEKARRNRYIKPFLTDENVFKLMEEFPYDQLKKGLSSCYHINIQIRSFTYIYNHIKGVK